MAWWMEGKTGLGLTGFALIAMLGVACDRIDGTASTGSGAGPNVENEAIGSEAANGRSGAKPTMESIGPDAAQRVYYQFIDDKGRVQFVERLSDVPPAWREQVGYVEMNQPPPLSPEEARRSWQVSDERATEILLAARSADTVWHASGGGASDVILYSASWCGYCTKARAHLDGEGIRYELRDVDIPAIGQELREKTGRGGVPVLDFSGEILRGYSADHYDRAIRSIRG